MSPSTEEVDEDRGDSTTTSILIPSWPGRYLEGEAAPDRPKSDSPCSTKASAVMADQAMENGSAEPLMGRSAGRRQRTPTGESAIGDGDLGPTVGQRLDEARQVGGGVRRAVSMTTRTSPWASAKAVDRPADQPSSPSDGEEDDLDA